MRKLRSEEGCPWDKEQTHESLKPYLIEETYEVLETIDSGDKEALREELGDFVLQAVFHAQIAAEAGDFTMEDVLNTINDKLIRRHPHVFGDVQIETAEEQKIHWETLKHKKEGKISVIEGVPKNAPALLRAHRVQQKAATVGFDWNDITPVWDKVHEELGELKTEIELDDAQKIEEEFGDLLFAIVNLSRFIKVNPEDALRKAINKFSSRFQQVEQRLKDDGKDIRKSTLDEMDIIWNQIKEQENHK
ncbi:nucleoside triphosphate pyrophosphohydrolase [candidate division KSB1 bacterium]|nr:nucleoside triphosphate pyrophosphohydrolase [candidate division KSB1 bacterium]